MSETPVRLLDYAGLASRGINFTPGHLKRLENAGKFPRRVKMGHSSSGYVESEIDQYIRGLIAARDNGKGFCSGGN